ncbi:MAG: DMT family transporter [Clostridiales bacterium]|nr:DMT family transporter [Clostridiales bacterium]
MKKEKNKMYALMCVLIVVWGLDFIIAKNALELFEPMSLLFFKYVSALALVLIIKIKTDGLRFVKTKDLPIYIICALLGEVAYYFCEYSAMAYLPVSLISIIIAFVPAVSVVFERVLHKKRTNRKSIAGILVCIFGIAMVIGVDAGALLQGRATGYLLALSCVFLWNAYNFITVELHKNYATATLTANQLMCTVIMLLPYVLHRADALPAVTPTVVLQMLYLGVLSSGAGFLIQVRALHVLGPTTTALFSNFLPVATTFFGWLILKETISPPQMAGGVIVIAAGYIVIKEKGKTEDLNVERETKPDNAD